MVPRVSSQIQFMNPSNDRETELNVGQDQRHFIDLSVLNDSAMLQAKLLSTDIFTLFLANDLFKPWIADAMYLPL